MESKNILKTLLNKEQQKFERIEKLANKVLNEKEFTSDNLSENGKQEIEERSPSEIQSIPNQSSILNVQFKDHNPFQEKCTSSKSNTDQYNKELIFTSKEQNKLLKNERNDFIMKKPKYSFIHHNKGNLTKVKDSNFWSTNYKTVISSSSLKDTDDKLFSLKSTQKSRNDAEIQYHTASKPLIAQINEIEQNDENSSIKVRMHEIASPSCETDSLDLITHNANFKGSKSNQKFKSRRLIGSTATTKFSPEILIAAHDESENANSHSRKVSSRSNYNEYLTNASQKNIKNNEEEDVDNS